MASVINALRDHKFLSSLYLAVCSTLAAIVVVSSFWHTTPLVTADRLLSAVGLGAIGAWLSGPLADALTAASSVVAVCVVAVACAIALSLLTQRAGAVAGSRIGSTIWLCVALMEQTGADRVSIPSLVLLIAGVVAGALRARLNKKSAWWEPAAGLLVTTLFGAVYLPLALLVWLVGLDDEPSQEQRAASITHAVLQAKRDDARAQELRARPVTIPSPSIPFMPRPRPRPGSAKAASDGHEPN